MASIPCPFCDRTFAKTAALLQHQKASQSCSSSVARGINDGSAVLVDGKTECVVNRREVAAALGGAVLVGSLIVGAAAAGAAALKPQVAERYTKDATPGGEQSVEEKIIEFERKLPFKGFHANHLFPNEPKFRHGDGNGIAVASKEDLLLPGGWAWADEWRVLNGASANESGTDAEGWMYAFNWGSEYAASASMTHCVRQRIWSRIRTCTQEGADGNPEKAKQQTAKAALPETSPLQELLEKNGLGDIFQKTAEELGLKTPSDLELVDKEDLDALTWLAPIPKKKLLRLVAEARV